MPGALGEYVNVLAGPPFPVPLAAGCNMAKGGTLSDVLLCGERGGARLPASSSVPGGATGFAADFGFGC